MTTEPDVLELVGTPYRDLVAKWPRDRRELFEERAAIMQVDGGLEQEEAERRAYGIVMGFL